MNIKSHTIIAFAFFMLLLPISQTHGATFISSPDEVASIRSEVTGDAYAFGDSVVIAAPVLGDIFAAALESIDISGPSSASIFAVGSNIHLTGNVQDDVRIAGDMLSIGSKITHDLFAAGSTLLVTKDSQVGGDAYLAGEQITVSGKINGNLFVASNKLTITSEAIIIGNITARGATPIIEDGATVSGNVKTIAPKEAEERERGGFPITRFIVSIISLAIFALALLFTAPVLVSRSKEFSMISPMQSGLTSVVWLIVFIPACILLLVSGFGIQIGVVIFLATMLGIFLGFGSMLITTGSIVYKLTIKHEGVAWHHCILGAIVVGVVSLLSFIGFITIAIAFIISFGAVLRAFWALMQGK